MGAHFTYANRLERFFANLLDNAFMFLPAVLIAALFGTADGLAILAVFLMNATYYTWFTASPWQATPAKRLLQMYVIHADGSPLSRRDALERFLAYSIPSLPLYTSLLADQQGVFIAFILSYVWFAPILYSVECIGLHDRICKTRVVAGKAKGT